MRKSKSLTKRLFPAIITLFITLTLVISFAATGMFASAASLSNWGGKYYTDYGTYAEAVEAACELNVDIAEEGTVLLKNQDNALPISVGNRVSVFGNTASKIGGTGGASGNGSGAAIGESASVPHLRSLATALSNQGYIVNKMLQNFYGDPTASAGGTERLDFTPQVESSFNAHNDVAFIVVTRSGGESASRGDMRTVLDGTRSSTSGTTTVNKYDPQDDNGGEWVHEALYEDPDGTVYKHELMLSNQEVALKEYVKAQGFKKIVYLINTPSTMELYNLENDPAIDGILWIGHPGGRGLEGVANVISGKANPSGKTQGVWVKDLTADPLWYNLSENKHVNPDQWRSYLSSSDSDYRTSDQVSKNRYLFLEDSTDSGTLVSTSNRIGGRSSANSRWLDGKDYEEDIWFSYRYYETVAADMNDAVPGSGDAWYEDAVVYPFGYGLSYSNFSYDIDKITLSDGSALSEGDTIDADDLKSNTTDGEANIKSGVATVKVTNSGSVAGKEAVQLYATAPYSGGAETPFVRLVGVEKTNVLLPGASQTLKISFNFQDIATYDWQGLTDQIKNSATWASAEKGFVLEEGDYVLRAMASSNAWMDQGIDYDEVNFDVDDDAYLHLDQISGNEISNKFSAENGIYFSVRRNDNAYGDVEYQFNESATDNMRLTSRTDFDGTFPEAPTVGDMTMSKDAINANVYWQRWMAGAGVRDFTERGYLDELESGRGSSIVLNTPGTHTGYLYQDGQTVWSKDGELVPAGTAGAVKIVGPGDFPWIAEYETGKSKMSTWKQEGAYSIITAEMSDIDPFDTVKTLPNDYSIATFRGKTHAAAWDIFMNQLTWREVESQIIINQKVQNYNIQMAAYAGADSSNNVSSTWQWPNNGLLASTLNKDLAEKQGIIVGNMLMFRGINSWYGNGTQVIRSAFGGRNTEYLAECGYLSGVMSSAVARGAQSKGIQCMIKHSILSDDSPTRGSFSWASEQAIREIYAKPFIMSVQLGGATNMMGSFNCIGRMYNGINYNWISMFRNDYGAEELNVSTDIHLALDEQCPADLMNRAGCDNMDTSSAKGLSGWWDQTARTGEGSVRYPANKAAYAKLSATNGMSGDEMGDMQYYFARINAMRFISNHSKTTMNLNGVSFSSWRADGQTATDSKAIAMTQGTALPTGTNALSVGGVVSGALTTKFVVTGGVLPGGVTVASDGTLSGVPTEAGTFAITITCVADNWISPTASWATNTAATGYDDWANPRKFFTITVAEAFSITNTSGTTGATFTAAISGISGGTYTTASILPNGLTLASNGMLTGTPTQSGTFPITVTATTTGSNAATYTYNFTLTIAAGAITAPSGSVVGAVINASGELVITYENGYTSNLGSIAGATGAPGQNGAAGADGSTILTGATAPTAAQGNDGDLYLKTDDFNLYEKSGGAWTLVGTLKGNTGDIGETGPTGPTGPTGATGPAGADGSGCNSTIAVSSIMLAAGIVAGAAVIVLFLRKKKEN